MARLRALLAALALAALLPGDPVRAAEQCFKFPVGVGPEEVCTTGSFRNGPIFAPPGLVTQKTFQFINLWVDTGGFRDANGDLVGDDLGGGNAVPPADLGFGAQYYPVKAANFDPARRFLFHYA